MSEEQIIAGTEWELTQRLALTSLMIAELMRNQGLDRFTVDTNNYDCGDLKIAGKWDEDSGMFEMRLVPEDQDPYPEDEDKGKPHSYGTIKEHLRMDHPDKLDVDMNRGGMTKIPRTILEQHFQVLIIALARVMREQARLNILVDLDTDVGLGDGIDIHIDGNKFNLVYASGTRNN